MSKDSMRRLHMGCGEALRPRKELFRSPRREEAPLRSRDEGSRRQVRRGKGGGKS